MKYSLALLLTSFCGVGIASADVVTNVTCQVGTTPAISNASNCSINAAGSRPSAAASVTVNQLTAIPASGLSSAFTATLSGSTNAIPLSNIGVGPNISSNATANATATYQLYTTGSVRTGVLTYFGSYSNWEVGPGDDSGQISASIGTLSGSCGGAQPSCSGLFGSFTSRSVPFTLGNSFSFQLSDVFAATGDPLVQGQGFARGTGSLTFQLFEADGTTPVALYAAPEPSTLGLLLVSAAGFGMAVVRGRRVRSGRDAQELTPEAR